MASEEESLFENWEDYLETRFIQTGFVREVAVCRYNGSIKAKRGMDNLSPDEVNALLSCLRDPCQFFESGLKVNKRKYVYVSGGTGIIRAISSDRRYGLYVAACQTVILVGICRNAEFLGCCGYVLEKQASFLQRMGY